MMAQKISSPHERHIRIGRYLKDAVYGANDGIITTFAVVAATVGGGLSPTTILIIGIANLLADGFSMATGNYLGTKSEQDFYKKEEAEEWDEVRNSPDEERAEVRAILAAKGYEGKDLDDLLRLITSREQFWIDFMMREELQLYASKDESAMRSALVTLCAFVAAGSVPLLPYLFFRGAASFLMVSAATGIALFLIGSLRAYFSRNPWWYLGFEMLMAGGLAAGIAYGVGALIGLMV